MQPPTTLFLSIENNTNTLARYIFDLSYEFSIGFVFLQFLTRLSINAKNDVNLTNIFFLFLFEVYFHAKKSYILLFVFISFDRHTKQNNMFVIFSPKTIILFNQTVFLK